mgnify:FL=1
MSKKNIAILGAGTMGTGIAQLFASSGHKVMMIYVYDDKERARPLETMEQNLRILADYDVISENDIQPTLDNVLFTESLEEAAQFADVIIECIVENLTVKQDYFKQLDELCPPETILCSNTSAISITEIAEKSVNKDRIIGTHFWNPAYLIPLVEVIRTEYVSEKTEKEIFEILEGAGKKPVLVKKDVPGFLANRLQHALFREAISIVENDIAEPKDVDDAIKYGFGMRLGVMAPMEVMDNGGLDLTYSIHKYLFPNIENTAKPNKLLEEKVNKGELGFKTGKGFQEWTEDEIAASRKNLTEGLIKVAKALDRL